MPFPDVPRVQYRTNLLEQVICQLRFPPILRIDAQPPATFQETIRVQYPNFAERVEPAVEFPPGFPEQFPRELFQQVLQPSSTKNYEFSAEEGGWKLNLTRTFLAVSTGSYPSWEEFRDRLARPLEALRDIYEPAHFSRIGLRFVNVIRRPALNLEGVRWQELLSPALCGLLGAADFQETEVKSFEASHEISLDNEGTTVRIRTRLVSEADSENSGFLLDNDFRNVRRTEVPQVSERLEFFHTMSTRLFRWSITDRLHNAMGPIPQ
jgi:uncharacterized protein (TIGR04255 family)